jgi:uncharacterized membrane protein
MKLLHVITAIWFVSGLLGRTLTMWQASQAGNVQTTRTLVHLAGYFERWMVIPGSLAVLGFGLVTAWLQRWPMLPPLQGSNWLLVSTLLYLSIIPLIPLVFLPRGKVFEKALEHALSVGEVTADLTDAFRDRTVGLAHAYELAVTLIVILLMVLKPF